MRSESSLSRRERLCMVIAAGLPWYGVLTGTFVLFIFVLMAAARLGSFVFDALWLGVIPLAVLLLLVKPAAFFAVLCVEGRPHRALLLVAQVGSAFTLTFSVIYCGISALIALAAFSVLFGAEYDLVFGALAALNAAMLAIGSWCVVVALRALWRLGRSARKHGCLGC